MNSSLNGEDLPINRRVPSAGRWALRDLADRDQRHTGPFGSFEGGGDPAIENPARPYRGSGGSYARR
ncbi:hypothetical protein GA0074692_5496 [Micromonospora pallida]|uniref:Uncharacterized protein n=1 Tax=Micromonospora pallida TaxID=145854 RepID=A0A1C6TDB5_9ACTN|nr:hypothetical protein [Micromonospora pallida]SCL39820.1 hypothetical protein GA0074692_5496 [Micromonospora pallida]